MKFLALSATLLHYPQGRAIAQSPQTDFPSGEEVDSDLSESSPVPDFGTSPDFVVPPDYTETVSAQASQSAQGSNAGTNPLPQLQNPAPRPRRPNTPGSGANSPDFLRGLQLADSGSRPGRRSHQSLLAPAQFHGNVFGTSGAVAINTQGESRSGDIPAAGGNARFSIADNNKPLPQNRVFFDYRHYNNAIGTDESLFGAPAINRRQDFDGFLFGIEKTLDEQELVSVDVRIPFSGNADVSFPGYQASGGEFGNIPVSWKQVLILEESYSLVAGSTIIAPTGGDVSGQMLGTPFSLNNEAWHLAPFVGGMLNPEFSGEQAGVGSLLSPGVSDVLERTTFQWFAAVDVPLNDQEAVVGGVAGGYRESTFMSLNSALVLNLLNAPKADNLTRLDGSVELHYLKDVGGGDSFVSPQTGFAPLTVSQSRVTDVLNLSAGFSAEIRKHTRVQLAAVAPLASSNSLSNRAFDSELILSINRFF